MMKYVTGPKNASALLSFNGGFIDTAGYLGLQGLFVAHVTGNFVTLGATLVQGSHGLVGKILALPEFVLVIALCRFAGTMMRAHDLPAMRILFGTKIVLLMAFFVLAVVFGPFEDADHPLALLTGFTGIAAMAVQNAVQRVHLTDIPPTTMMTGTTVQATLDAMDILTDIDTPTTQARFRRLFSAIFYFASGCAISALLYALIGFWCLALTIFIGTAAASIAIDLEKSAAA